MEGTLLMDADRSDEERMRRRAAGRLEAFAPLRLSLFLVDPCGRGPVSRSSCR